MNGPRFVWNVGAIREEFPDMPEQGSSLVLWDRQEQKPVATVAPEYAQLLCLETTNPDGAPFTALEAWANRVSNRALESEGITPTIAP